MRRKCFRGEDVRRFIWDAADEDGIWNENDAAIAAEFGVTEDEANKPTQCLGTDPRNGHSWLLSCLTGAYGCSPPVPLARSTVYKGCMISCDRHHSQPASRNVRSRRGVAGFYAERF